MPRHDIAERRAVAKGPVVYADARLGKDSNKGTIDSPVATVGRAVELSRSAAAPGAPRSVSLRQGYFYVPSPVELGPADSGLSIAPFAGETAVVSGAAPLDVEWLAHNVGPDPVYPSGARQWLYRDDITAVGSSPVSEGPILSNGTAKAWQDCEARCKANFTAGGPCTVWTLLGRDHGTCWFRTDGVYAPVAEYGAFSGYLTPPSAPLPPANIWKADLSGLKLPSEGVTGVRVNGSRMIKARFPNANPEWQGFASNLEASSWTAPTTPVNPTIEFNPPRPHRNNSGQFSQYQLGIGGPCEHFSPQAGYWCGNHTSGGGAFTYRVPSGMVAGKDVFPHMPYANATGAIVQTWRPGHWSSWAFEVGSLDDSTSTWAFTKGGFQGARGDTKGDNVYLQNVVEEMDTSGEWFFDREAQTLYLFHNGTGPPPSARGAPAGTEPAAAVSGTNTLFRIVGTPQSPVRDVSISGLTIRDAGETLLNETVHGMPSGGDWALGRVGAVYAEGTARLSLVGNDVTRCDGNGFLLFGYHRDATISRNSFSWMGETCVALWGKTAGAPGGVDGMGPDGTQGEQPENTMVEGNLAREFGIWEKQSSFFFQAKTGTTTLLSNIAYNGPRAQVNFNDGFRGGNNMTKNILFNSCRESGDRETAPGADSPRASPHPSPPSGTGGRCVPGRLLSEGRPASPAWAGSLARGRGRALRPGRRRRRAWVREAADRSPGIRKGASRAR